MVKAETLFTDSLVPFTEVKTTSNWLDELQLFAWTIGNRDFDLLHQPIPWAKPYCTSLSPGT